MARGEFVGAIAMTEPGAGSDLQAVRTSARREGNAYVLNGQKTFITNGQAADLVIVVARTGEPGAKGLSLIVVETAECDGFRRGRSLDKIGLHASDTAELFFDNAVAPPETLLGAEEGQGFVQLMQQLPQERLSIAVAAVMFTLGAAWATCIDTGGHHTGVVSAMMNTAGNTGAIFSPIIAIYAKNHLGGWNAPLYVMAGLFLIGAICWCLIDPRKSVFV